MGSKKTKTKTPPISRQNDIISNNSASIDSVEEDQFIVSHILAEKSKGGKPLYLVKWEGYPEEESTWEPVESFLDPKGILAQWRQTQDRIKKGFDQKFDVAAWKLRREEYEKAQRRQKQNHSKEPVAQDKEKAAKETQKKQSQQPTPAPSDNKRRLVITPDDDAPETAKRQKPLDEPIFVSEHENHVSEHSTIDKMVPRSEKESPVIRQPSKQLLNAHTRTTPQKPPEAHKDGAINGPKSALNSRTSLQAKQKKQEIPSGNFESPQASMIDDDAGTNLRKGSLTASRDAQQDANISRRDSRDQSNSTSHVSATIAKKPPGSNNDIVVSSDTQPVTQKRRMEEGKLYSISHRYRLEMQGRNEAEPNIDDITLTELSTGKIVSEPKAKSSPPPQAPKAPRALRQTRPKDVDGLVPLTCPYFRRNIGCEWEPCPFLHKLSDEVASYALYEQYVNHQTGKEIWPKFKEPPEMCPYWFARRKKTMGCTRTIEDCWHAHWLVQGGAERLPTIHIPCPHKLKGVCRYGAECIFAHSDAQGVVSSPLRRESGTEDMPTTKSQHEINDLSHSADSSRRTSLAGKTSTCPYWYQGKCKKSENECKHAHVLLEGGISWLPSKNQTCSYWREGRCRWPEEKCLYAHKNFGPSGPYYPMDERLSIDSDSSHLRYQPRSKSRHANCWRPEEDIHPDGLRSFNSLDSRTALTSIDDGSWEQQLLLSLPDGNEDMACAIIEPTKELREILASTASQSIQVQGLVPAWLLKQMRKSNPNFIYTELRAANRKVSEALSSFLKTNETLCLVKLPGAFLFIYFESQPPAALGQLAGYHVAALTTNEENGFSSKQNQLILFVREVEKALRITSDQFFSWSSGNTNQAQCQKSVCLMFDDKYDTERKLWSIYFDSIGATVFSYDIKGSWDLFCRGESGAIISHPEFAMYNIIPDFGKQLMGRRNVFQLGYDFRQDGPEARFEATQLFPYGTTVLMTDGIYIHHPKAALRILEDINKHNGDKPPIVWTWRLAGRRGIKHWLMDLAVKHERELQAGDSTRFDLFNALLALFPDEFMDEDDPQHPRRNAPLITMDEMLMEDYTELWKTEPQRALERIVDWFAYTALTMRHVCRRFVVVHDGVVPLRWREKNQHVLFYTPEKYFERFNVGDRRTSLTDKAVGEKSRQ